jgi:ABC-type phosphate/phosphonate transport system substrate-binding protein
MGLFELVTARLGAALDDEASLSSRTDRSGPAVDDDPFARGEIDVGFVCGPSVRALTSIDVVAAPVFSDARARGRPVYFSELVARSHAGIRSLSDLAGRRVGYNDRASLSGHGALMDHLGQQAVSVHLVQTGGHRESLRLLESGAIDAAAIDSNTIRARGGLPRALTIVETWGPFPVQPVVVRTTLGAERRDAIRDALISMADDEATASALTAFDVERFVIASRADYDVMD